MPRPILIAALVTSATKLKASPPRKGVYAIRYIITLSFFSKLLKLSLQSIVKTVSCILCNKQIVNLLKNIFKYVFLLIFYYIFAI